jgi:hypothetical protein
MKKCIVTWCFLCLMTVMTRCQSLENSQQGFSPIHCSLACAVNDKKVWANVVFSNTTESVIGVFDRNLLKTDDLFWSPFEVSCNGTNIPYTGFTEKRAAPSPAEFYLMKPHEVVNSRTEITKFYNLTSSGDCEVKYFAINPPFQNVDLFVIQSTPVKFRKK